MIHDVGCFDWKMYIVCNNLVGNTLDFREVIMSNFKYCLSDCYMSWASI
jgi:hypothetical protein